MMFKFKRNRYVSELDRMRGFWGGGNVTLPVAVHDDIAHTSFDCERLPAGYLLAELPYSEIQQKLCEECAHLKTVDLYAGAFSTGELEQASLFVESLLSGASSNMRVLSFFSFLSSVISVSVENGILLKSEVFWLDLPQRALDRFSRLALVASALDSDSRLQERLFDVVKSPGFFDESIVRYASSRENLLPHSASGSSLLAHPQIPTRAWFDVFEVVRGSGVLLVPDSLASLFGVDFFDAFDCKVFSLPEGFTLDQVETASVLYEPGGSNLSLAEAWSAACALES